MRGAMLFAAGLFAGLAIQVGIAQNGNGGVVMMNTSDTKAILANSTDAYMGRIELAELTPESLHYKAIQNWK